jgi:hypothetical protein
MSYNFSYITVNNCIITQSYSGHYGIKASDGGIVNARSNTISNCTGAGAAIQALRSGTVYSSSNTGSNNAYGLYASEGGTIAKGDAIQPSGTQAEKILTSGQIIPFSTTASMTIYVNDSTGNDTTGDGSLGSPFLTIAKALSCLPEIINHPTTINLTGTFGENIVISGKRGSGSITVAGPGGTGADGTKASISRLQVDTSIISVSFYNITATATDNIPFYAADTKRLNIYYCTSTVSALTQTGIYAIGSEIRAENCTISNKNRAIYANMMGRIYSYNNGGTGNNTGLLAGSAGIIYKANTTQPAGTTAESYNSAGRIVTPT